MTKELPTHVLENIKEFLIVAMFQRLGNTNEMDKNALANFIGLIAIRLSCGIAKSAAVAELTSRDLSKRVGAIELLIALVLQNPTTVFEFWDVVPTMAEALLDPHCLVISSYFFTFNLRSDCLHWNTSLQYTLTNIKLQIFF